MALYGEDYVLVISQKCHVDKTLDLQKIYLKKQQSMKNCHIIPLNLTPQNPVREHFIHSILQVDDKHWNRYWDKMHFKGVKAPHVVRTNEAMAAYIITIPGAIGYIPEAMISRNMNIISRFELD